MQLFPMNASTHTKFLIFNQQEFYTTIGDDEGLGKEILAVALNELPARIRNIQNCLKHPETDILRREIHDLKGIVGLLGCSDLHHQLSSLKTIGQPLNSDQLTVLHGLVERLKMLEKDLKLFSKMEH